MWDLWTSMGHKRRTWWWENDTRKGLCFAA